MRPILLLITTDGKNQIQLRKTTAELVEGKPFLSSPETRDQLVKITSEVEW